MPPSITNLVNSAHTRSDGGPGKKIHVKPEADGPKSMHIAYHNIEVDKPPRLAYHPVSKDHNGAKMTTPTLPATDWPEPTPLTAEVAPPPFPTEALPQWTAAYIRAQATASQVPEDLPGMLVLSALSAAVQGRINTVANNNNWIEPITLYTAIAMNPGERKSSIFEHITRPLMEWEIDTQELEWPIVSESQQELIEIQKAIESADNKVQKLGAAFRDIQRNEAANPDSVRAAQADLIAARQDGIDARVRLQKHDTRYKMRLIHNDLTPEACVTALGQQRSQHIAIMSDEGGVFEVLTGARYSDRLNLDVFLKGHSGNMIMVDRVGRESETIRRPILSLGLAVQPQVLRDIGASKQMSGRGLLARFLYCIPETLIGGRAIDSEQVPGPIWDAYSTNLREIATQAYARREILVLPLDDEANSSFIAFQKTLEPRLTPEIGDLDQIIEWASKFAGAILRTATLIACARSRGLPEAISGDDMASAIAFAPYFEAHAHRAFAMMGITSGTGFESRLLRRIERERWIEFTTRDAMRITNASRLYNKEEFEEILDSLGAHGYLRRVVDSTKPFRYHWNVNPALYRRSA